LLAPTASGDGAGERFCAPLPPSSPRFRGIALKKRRISGKPVFLTFFFVGTLS
jgi:hypothetical protein